jgi:hypothetical protein
MKLIHIVALAAALAVACAPRAASPGPTATSTATSTATAAPTVAAATTTPAATAPPTTAAPASGIITGLVGYPAEGHPTMTICAFATTDRGVTFCVDVPQATTPPKSPYTITGVRPGTYHVFAYAQGNDRAGGAYTEYVRCGLMASCSDHTLIAVAVRAGETVRDIDVADWYGPTEAFPPRPR